MDEEYVVYHEGKKVEPQLHLQINKKQILENSLEVHQMKDIFSTIKQWKIQILQFYQIQNPSIIKEISPIIFPNLRRIVVEKNNIETLEGFSSIYMPIVKTIYLSNNKISSVSDMRKSKWFQLESIGIENNIINQLSALPEAAFPKVDHLFVEFGSHKTEQECNINFIAKLNTPKLSSICKKQITEDLTYDDKIQQKNSKAVLDKKSQKMRISLLY